MPFPRPLALGLATALAALSALLCRGQADGAAPPTEQRLAAWDFEQVDGAVVADTSGNGHSGTARALEPHNPPAAVDGMVGRALQFSARHGTDVVVGDDAALSPTDGLTVAAWIKHEGPIQWTAEILGKKGQAKAIVDGYRLYLTRAGRLCFEIGDGTAVSRVSAPNRTIKPDTWYHVAATFAPGRLRLFLNTRLIEDRQVDAQRIAASPNKLVIGNFAGRRNAYPFNGMIDEVELLAVALDADAIFRLARPQRLSQ